MTWNEAFASRYDEWAAHRRDDIAFYVSLPLEAHGDIVELAVGNGRVAIPVAEATGERLIGIDLAPTMLSEARDRAAERTGETSAPRVSATPRAGGQRRN